MKARSAHKLWYKSMLFAVCLSLMLPMSQSLAAPFNFSVTYQKSFDSMITESDQQQAATLKKQVTDLQSLQNSIDALEQKTIKLKEKNDAEEKEVRQQIASLSKSNTIAQLTKEVAAAKISYQSLNSVYKNWRDQQKAARAAKKKELANSLDKSVQTAKAAADLAKVWQQDRQARLRTAKATAASQMKQLRQELKAIQTHKAAIKSSRTSITTIRKQYQAEMTTLKAAVKQQSSKKTQVSFEKLHKQQQRILQARQTIHSQQEQIDKVIKQVRQQAVAK